MDSTATCLLPHRSTPSAVAVGAHELSTQALVLQGAAHELADARARLEQAEAVFSRALCVFTRAEALPTGPDPQAAAAAQDLEQSRRGSTRVADFSSVLHTIDAFNERCLGVDAARSSRSNAVLRRIIELQSERAAIAHALARGVIESDLAAAKRRQQSLTPLLRSLPSIDEVKAGRLASLERGRAWLKRSGISATADSTLEEEEEYVVVDQESPISPRGTPSATVAAAPVVPSDGRSIVHAANLASVVDRARHGLEGLLSASRIGRQLRKKGAAVAAAPSFFGRALTDANVAAALWFQRICGDFILQHGAKLTGVLRVPGDRAAVNALKGECWKTTVITFRANPSHNLTRSPVTYVIFGSQSALQRARRRGGDRGERRDWRQRRGRQRCGEWQCRARVDPRQRGRIAAAGNRHRCQRCARRRVAAKAVVPRNVRAAADGRALPTARLAASARRAPWRRCAARCCGALGARRKQWRRRDGSAAELPRLAPL